jgi:hypothetical protein
MIETTKTDLSLIETLTIECKTGMIEMALMTEPRMIEWIASSLTEMVVTWTETLTTDRLKTETCMT